MIRQGLSLIEVLVVLSIVVVLSFAAASFLDGVRSKAMDQRRLSDINELQVILANYKTEEGFYPPALTFGAPLIGSANQTFTAALPTQPTEAMYGKNCRSQQAIYVYNYDAAQPNSYSIDYCLERPTKGCPGGKVKAIPGNSVKCDFD